MGGDFNVPGTGWSDGLQSEPKSVLQEALADLITENHLTQKVTFPTRRDQNGTENTLDLLLTSHPDLINDVSPLAGISDHCIIQAKFRTNVKVPTKPPRNIPLWKKINTDEFKGHVSKLARNFFDLQPEGKTVEENWIWFRDSLNGIVTKYIPHKLIKGRTRAPWFTSKLKRLCSKKEKAYNCARKSNRISDWDIFTRIRKQVDCLIRSAHRSHVSSILESDHPKKFWRYVKSRRTDSTGIKPLKVNNRLLTKDNDKAEALANQFHSAFTREDTTPSTLPDLPPSPFPDMPPIVIDELGVKNLLNNINPAKAIGPDLIQNQALKIAADEIAPVLQFIFQKSLDTGDLPLDWRKANITPIFKKGTTTDPVNYRPISLTSTCSKLLEHIIDSNLMRHLSKHNILAGNQHAFRKYRSCESQLILTTNDLAKNLDNRKITDIAVLDFSKAFDVIPHQRLLKKLDFYGIQSNTKNWIAGFLTKRLQRVCVNGKSSEWLPVLSGTPQGTVLGPHLFLLHINDIHEKVSSTTRLFADDCLLYRTIESAEDEETLQKDLDTMVQWSKTWGMHFNPTKCKIMRVTRKETPGIMASYNILGVNLEAIKETKYLGINLQSDLRWNSQTHYVTTKAIGVLSFLRRNFHHCSPGVKEKLYLTLVRPHLDYAIAAWDPYTKKHITSIERVQRQAARFVTNTYGEDTSVTKLLNQLDWGSLKDRREAHRLTSFYKMLNGKLDVDYKAYTDPKPDRCRRGHPSQFVVPTTNSDVYANSFFPRTIKAWNDLQVQETTILKTSPHVFKSTVLKEAH